MADQSYLNLFDERVAEIRGSLAEVTTEDILLKRKIVCKTLPGVTAQESMLWNVEIDARKEAKRRGAALVGMVGILSSLAAFEKMNQGSEENSTEINLLLFLAHMYVKLYRQHSTITVASWREAMRLDVLPFLKSSVLGLEEVGRYGTQHDPSAGASYGFRSGRRKPASSSLFYEILMKCHWTSDSRGMSSDTRSFIKEECSQSSFEDERESDDGSVAQNHLKLVLRRTLEIGRFHQARAQRAANRRKCIRPEESRQNPTAIESCYEEEYLLPFWKEMSHAVNLYISQGATVEW